MLEKAEQVGLQGEETGGAGRKGPALKVFFELGKLRKL